MCFEPRNKYPRRKPKLAYYLLAFILFSVGCPFDGPYLRDRRLPVRLQIENQTKRIFSISALVHTQDAKGGFVLARKVQIAPKDFHELRIPETTYSDIKEGRFIIRGHCEGQKEKEFLGPTFLSDSVKNAKEWWIKITISKCE